MQLHSAMHRFAIHRSAIQQIVIPKRSEGPASYAVEVEQHPHRARHFEGLSSGHAFSRAKTKAMSRGFSR